MKNYQTLRLYEEANLLIDDEAVMLAAKASEYGNVYGIDGAGVEDLPTLNGIEISDNTTVADVAAAVNEMTCYFDTNGCQCGEVLDVENFEIVYCPAWKEFIAVENMNTYAAYLFWGVNRGFRGQGSGMGDIECIWLPESEHIIDVEDAPDLTITNEYGHTQIYPIDRLDYEPVDDKYLLRYISQEDQPSGSIVSGKALDKLLQNVGDCIGPIEVHVTSPAKSLPLVVGEATKERMVKNEQ